MGLSFYYISINYKLSQTAVSFLIICLYSSLLLVVIFKFLSVSSFLPSKHLIFMQISDSLSSLLTILYTYNSNDSK